MCLYTKRAAGTTHKRKKEELKTAMENILVFKRLDVDGAGRLTSPHRGTKFNPDGMSATLGVRRDTTIDGIRFEVNEGLHAYTSKKIAGRQNKDNRIYPAIVPKGAQYMVSENTEEIVATEMKLYFKPVEPKPLTF